MKVNKTYLSQLQTQTGDGQYVGHSKIKSDSARPAADKKLFQQILKDCLSK